MYGNNHVLKASIAGWAACSAVRHSSANWLLKSHDLEPGPISRMMSLAYLTAVTTGTDPIRVPRMRFVGLIFGSLFASVVCFDTLVAGEKQLVLYFLPLFRELRKKGKPK